MSPVITSLQPTQSLFTTREYVGLLLLTLIVYLPGLFVPLMDNDSAHHANIALHMFLHNDYINLIDRGEPYLDKPHLLFWTAAGSYHLFGVTAFAYKLPSFLFTLLGTYSTYRLGAILYNKATGWLAALIVSTAFAYILATNDVRMDAMLTASVIFAMWQLVAYTRSQGWLNLVLAALGLALGFATKGMVGVAVPGIALLLFLLYERNWSLLFHWQWLLLVVLFFVFASPVLYAYYVQFDLHPELEVRGRSGVSGVRFILWEQNLERMQGESFGAKGEIRYTYFLHTFIWAFMPWSMLAVVAIVSRVRQFLRNRFRFQQGLEFLTLGGILFFMILFSLSRFKLPHYLNILFPLFAILLADYLHQSRNKTSKLRLFWVVQVFVLVVMVATGLMINLWMFPVNQAWVIVAALVLLAIWLRTFFSKQDLYKKIISWTVTGTVLVLFLINANFYPQLLGYQAGNVLAAIGKQNNIDPSRVFTYQTGHSFSYDFYTAYLHDYIDLETVMAMQDRQEQLWLLTDNTGIASLETHGITIRRRHATPDFHVTRLKWKFLNPDTRPEATTNMYLVQL